MSDVKSFGRSQASAGAVVPKDGRETVHDGRERVVILGSGWAGYILSRKLDTRKFKPIVVSPRSYFVFTPFLNDSATGKLAIESAVEPVRTAKWNGDFVQAWAESVDFEKKTLVVEPSVLDSSVTGALTTNDDGEKHKSGMDKVRETISYDKLVISVGCYAQTFGTKGVKENALFLKDVGDAQRIRRRVLEVFEIASLDSTPLQSKKYLLHFAIVGGGPTGTEFAATLSDLIREDLTRVYPDLVQHVRISLFDVAPRILSMFDESLMEYALKVYKREGVEIKTSHNIEELRKGHPGERESTDSKQGPGGVYTLHTKEEGEIGVGLVVWSTGNMANPFVQKLGSEVRKDEKTGSISINERLQVLLEDPKGGVVPDVFAIGDNAVPESGPLPATAQVANQEAEWLAKRFNNGDLASQKFQYKDLGVLTYLGSSEGAVQPPKGGAAGGLMKNIKGRLAYFIWRGAYLIMTLSWKNRLLVPIHWALVKMFGRDISRF